MSHHVGTNAPTFDPSFFILQSLSIRLRLMDSLCRIKKEFSILFLISYPCLTSTVPISHVQTKHGGCISRSLFFKVHPNSEKLLTITTKFWGATLYLDHYSNTLSLLCIFFMFLLSVYWVTDCKLCYHYLYSKNHMCVVVFFCSNPGKPLMKAHNANSYSSLGPCHGVC